MGYDNECVVNILTLPGEYFCPVCRTLIYPNEALQSQCTHLYCKPCLAYVVATTHACPYDGYLVTEADSKPLVESNKDLADTIGKVAVHCLYHRSGCQWQGTLAESTAHCATCNYGNSAVVCNRCGTQIIHRQVQEHAQICPGVQPQGQVVENAQSQAAAVTNQVASQDPSSAASAASAPAATAAVAIAAAPAAPATASAPASAPAAAAVAPGQAQVQGGAYAQPAAQAPTADQWYQQQQLQYQQYYQQYPGYDPYQQQYQQYAQYQQQVYPQYAQPQMQPAPQQVIPGQQQPQPYMQQPQPQLQPGQPQAPQAQPQLQPQTQPQGQAQAQPQAQPHSQTQPQPHVPTLAPQMQPQQPIVPPQQPHPHVQSQAHQPPHGHPAGQPYPQPQPHAPQARPPQLPGPPQPQQPVPPQQLPQQVPHPQAYPQHQARPQHPLPHPQHQHQQPPLQMQPHPQPHPQPQLTPQMQHMQPSANALPGYQSYPQPIPGPPQQRPMQIQPQPQGMPPQQQFPPQQPPQTHPPHPQMPMPVQPQQAMPPPQVPQANLHLAQQQGQQPMHQPVQQVYQQSGMQPHGQHGFPPPQAHGLSHASQPLQQNPAPPQHQVHPQQSLRPQGPAYMQQPTHGHPHQQGLPTHQAQSRPMMVNQGMSQQSIPQSPGGGSKPMQPGFSQQSPNRNYMARANPRGPTDSEMQSGHLQNSGSQGGLMSASPATPKQGAATADKIGQVQTSEGGLAVQKDEGTTPGEQISELVGDSRSAGNDEGRGALGAKDKEGQAENDRKDVSERLEENMDVPLARQGKVEEGANKSGQAMDGPHGEKQNHGVEGKPEEKSGGMFKGEGSHSGPDKSLRRESLRPNIDRSNHGFVSDGQMATAAVNSMHPSQQQQHAHQNVLPAQTRGYPQTGYNDRNPSQFPQQYPVSDDRHGIPLGAPQQVPYGHPPQMPDPAMVSQRPPAPDRMFPQPMHQSNQERRFPEPSSYQTHAHGPVMPTSQMRPPGHNIPEPFPHPGQMPAAQEPFWPPPHVSAPGPALPSVPGGPSSHHGFPPKGFEQQGMGHQGQALGHLPPPHVGGARNALGEPLAHPSIGGPPPGPLDTPNRMVGGPSFMPEDQMGKPSNINAMEVEAHKRSGFYDGRQPEPHRPLPTEHTPYGEPNVMKMNGRSSNMPPGGMHDSAFAHGLPEDRFRPLPEDRFKPFPEDGFKGPPRDETFRPSALDPGRHMVNRREFEEDLKQFPRPAHLDGEVAPRFDGYLSSSRPVDRMPLPSGGINTLTSRPLPGAPFPPAIGGPDIHMDTGDRPVGLHEHPGRRHDGTFPHPDRLNLVSEFGRHRADGLPPLRSPGHFGRDIPDALPSQLRRGLDGGPPNHNIPSNLRGSEIGGPQNMPSFFRGGGGFGGLRSHLDISEQGGPGNLPPHLRTGDPSFNGRFNSGSREGDIDSFDQSRKRKAGGMVRCLICKVDVETVEGLELHSQRREHQKMAMDIVQSIKKENAKKLRTVENVTPFEDANKSRKANFEKRGNRH